MTWFTHVKVVLLGALILSALIVFVFLTPKAILGYTLAAVAGLIMSWIVGVAAIGIVGKLHEGEDV